MDKDVEHIYIMEYYSATREPFAEIQMMLEIIILSEISQKEKNKYHMISFICGISNLAQIYKTEIDS